MPAGTSLLASGARVCARACESLGDGRQTSRAGFAPTKIVLSPASAGPARGRRRARQRLLLILNQVVPRLTAPQKTGLINAYTNAVTTLAAGGWLTSTQSATLKMVATQLWPHRSAR